MQRKRISHRRTVGPSRLTLAKQVCIIYKRNARERGVPFELHIIEFSELIQRLCIYCGAPPGNTFTRHSRGYPPFKYQGIDRLDNSKGYTSENSVPCCATCNGIKSNILSPREMLAAMQAVKKIRK